MTQQTSPFFRRSHITTQALELFDEFMVDPNRTKDDDQVGASLSVFGRTLWRYAEGTLGDCASPYWQQTVEPALKKCAPDDRPLVALALAGIMLSALVEFGLSWAVLSGTLPAEAEKDVNVAA